MFDVEMEADSDGRHNAGDADRVVQTVRRWLAAGVPAMTIAVAFTRARRALVVVGDSATVSNHPFDLRMVSHLEAIGASGSVREEESAAAVVGR